MIKVSEVSKRYKNKLALKPTNMNLEAGRIVGLLGPNGSGKTTLLRILSGELRADTGSFSVDGLGPSPKLKDKISAFSNADFLPQDMTLTAAADLYEGFFKDFSRDHFYHLLGKMKLEPSLKVGELSKGMKNNFYLALALSRKAKLIILDEPMDGVDPIAREDVLTLIAAGFDGESTILVTSHMISEIERLLDDVYFIRQGEVKEMGAAEDLRQDHNMSLDQLYREVYSK